MRKLYWRWLSIGLVILIWMMAMAMYGRMPEIMVTHWGLRGEPNGYMGRFWGVMMLPILTTVINVGMRWGVRLDPKRKEIEKQMAAYERFIFFMCLFFVFIFLLVIGWNVGWVFDMGKMMVVGLAVLFWETGRLVGRVNPNYTIGIRTPWTLASDEVWKKTHTFGSRAFRVAAVLGLIGLVDGDRVFWWMILPILVVSVVMVVYSALIYHKK